MTQNMEPCPPPGEGVHFWILKFAHAQKRDGFTPQQAMVRLRKHITRDPRPGEIEGAVCKAYSSTSNWESASPNSKWPSVNLEQREAIIASGWGCVDLFEQSPIRIDSETPLTEEIIDSLFPKDSLLCVGCTTKDFMTKQRESFRGELSGFQHIVPNPMSAVFGITTYGRKSQHTLSNTGPRRFLVLEQDFGSFDEQAAIIGHLAERAPLALVVFSGKKSIHGWFYCQGQAEDRLLRFMRYAVSVGADRATWTRSQFVRMPGATRDNGIQQCVYYFNPGVIK
jgi:hypothetical protein